MIKGAEDSFQESDTRETDVEKRLGARSQRGRESGITRGSLNVPNHVHPHLQRRHEGERHTSHTLSQAQTC